MPNELQAPPELVAIHQLMAREGTRRSIEVRSEALGRKIADYVYDVTGNIAAFVPLEVVLQGTKMTLALSTAMGFPSIVLGKTLNDAFQIYTMRGETMNALRWDGRDMGDTDLDVAEKLFKFIKDNKSKEEATEGEILAQGAGRILRPRIIREQWRPNDQGF